MTWKLLALLIFLSTLCIAEAPGRSDSHDSAPAGDGQPQRTEAAEKISDLELPFLTKWFDKAPESIKNRHENKSKPELFIPAGITQALKKESPDETVIANAIAELMGSRNDKQKEEILAAASKKASEERQKEPGKRDDRFLALVERIEWAAAWLLGKPIQTIPDDPTKTEALKRFYEKFKPAMDAVDKANEEVLKYIDLAKQGDATAKTWLRSNLDQKSLTQFLKGQKSSGGDKLAEDVVDALSNVSSDGAFKFLDFSHEAGVDRLVFSKSGEDTGKALDGFLKQTEGQNRQVVFGQSARKPEEIKNRFWDRDKKSLVEGGPQGFQATAAKPTSGGSSGPDQAAQLAKETESKKAFQKLKEMLNTQRCNACHTAAITGTSLKDAKIIGKAPGGRSYSKNLKEFISVVDNGNQMKKVIKASELELLEKWAALP